MTLEWDDANNSQRKKPSTGKRNFANLAIALRGLSRDHRVGPAYVELFRLANEKQFQTVDEALRDISERVKIISKLPVGDFLQDRISVADSPRAREEQIERLTAMKEFINEHRNHLAFETRKLEERRREH
ncbi:MAG: hypothetical protein ABH863_04110 [Candidatus Micrarchaeota archaeon]